MKRTFSFLLILTLALSLHAGPFGLELDWDLVELGSNAVIISGSAKDRTGSVLYEVLPPSPEAPYTHYFAEVNDTFGLWRIIAVSDPAGSIKELTEAFREELDRVSAYGDPIMDGDTFIRLSSPGILSYLALGETSVGAVVIPDPPIEDFTLLSLTVESDDGETGYIRIECWSLWLTVLVNGMY